MGLSSTKNAWYTWLASMIDPPAIIRVTIIVIYVVYSKLFLTWFLFNIIHLLEIKMGFWVGALTWNNIKTFGKSLMHGENELKKNTLQGW
jgi:hypothetical protein